MSLEARIKLCIGENAARPDADWSGQYKHLFPAMMKLATDVDSFARELFEQLTIQVHTSASNHRNLHTHDSPTPPPSLPAPYRQSTG